MAKDETAYDLVCKRLAEAEAERSELMSSAYAASSDQISHNKGMRKAYFTLKLDLEAVGLAFSTLPSKTTDVV